jgi:hypothetical protein
MKKLISILGAVVVLCGLLTAYHGLDTYVAKAADLALVAQRLDAKIDGDRADRIQDRLWKIEDRYRGKVMPAEELQLYRELTRDLKDLNQKMKKK